MSALESILKELGDSLKITLQPDEHNACQIRLPNDLALQMELDPDETFFYMDIILGEVPEGQYREKLFQQAMKFNGRIPPKNDIFAYSDLKNCFLIFKRLPVQGLSGKRVFDLLPAFCQKAVDWKEAIDRGEIPEIEKPEESGADLSNVLGLKP